MEIDRHSHSLGMLRHRVFPRAMAWDVHHAAQHTAGRAYDNRDDRAAAHYHTAAYEYAPRGVYAYADDDRRMAKAAKYDPRGSPSSSYAAQHFLDAAAARAPTTDGRERLFRTIGKWLDHPQRPRVEDDDEREYLARRHAAYERSYPPQHVYVQAPPPMDAHPSRHGPALFDMVKLHHGAGVSPVSYASSRSMSMSSHPSPTHSNSSAGNSKKRQRGPTGSTAPPTGVARPGMSTSSAKRCSVTDCGKIAVSKGLCRGHGGGRRCTFVGCTKCAQSRSPFCWAHGGGKRCEAPNCRRSRKTKRFCVDHVEMENTVPISTDSDSDHRSQTPSDDSSSFASSVGAATHGVAALHLPSLTDALKRAVPAAVVRASSQTVTLPQSRDRLWPAQPQAAAAQYH